MVSVLRMIYFGPDCAYKNQMQDAMTIWDSICHSQWFKNTSIVSHLTTR